MAAQIKKIVLDIDGKKVELTVEQAKELKQMLEDMWDSAPVSVPYPIYIERWRYPHYYWGTSYSDNTAYLSCSNE